MLMHVVIIVTQLIILKAKSYSLINHTFALFIELTFFLCRKGVIILCFCPQVFSVFISYSIVLLQFRPTSLEGKALTNITQSSVYLCGNEYDILNTSQCTCILSDTYPAQC